MYVQLYVLIYTAKTQIGWALRCIGHSDPFID